MIQIGRFDRLGSGVRNINKYLPLYAKGAKPTFEETDRGFRLTIPITPKVTTTTKKASEKTSEKIISLVRKDATITIERLAEATNVTTRSVERNLKKLQEQNRIKRVGPQKGGHWVILKD